MAAIAYQVRLAYNNRMATMKVGFIGPGKVGCSLGRYITEKTHAGFAVSGYFGRSEGSAQEAASLAGGRAFDTPEELAAASDLILLTVPDNQIESVWAYLSEKLPDRSDPLYIGHCSGSQSAEVFRPQPHGCHFGSMHPLIAVYDKENSHEKFPGCYFTIEGAEAFIAAAGGLLTALGNPWREIDATHKTGYHAASVIISNLVCALVYTGTEIFKACGLDDEFADDAWHALFLENAENTAALGPVRALTGPVERCDTATVARHLETLSGEAREIYLLLSRTLTETAKRKNPERDYSKMIQLLESMR